MSGRIPENIVERIKNESDIVAIISEFVSLKKSGKDYKGLCPFHQEKTPSFFVIPAKGFYHCFGCGKGGNAVNFIMEHERLEYPAALRFLAEKAGITIPETGTTNTFEEILYNSLSTAAAFYEKCLYESSAGKKTLDYLKKRGISVETARKFGFGFAPDGWDNLIKFASAKSIKAADLEAAGLAIRKEGFYDRFRNRLTIPIRTLAGKVVGFGARVLQGDDSPKYINSPETAIYKKGRILYGLDVSKSAIRDKNEAVVVEGYFDLIALHQAGIENVVAVSGTGFTPEQASLLNRFCTRVVLLFDSDSAGIRAAFRACGVLYNYGLEPYLVRLPAGFDPDSFVREKGAKALTDLIAQASDIIDFVRQGLKGSFSDQTLSRQKKIVGALTELMAPIDDNLTRDLLSRKMFEKLDIDTKTLGIIGETGKPREETEEAQVVTGRDRFEREFLACLIANPDLVSRCTGAIDGSLFTESSNLTIFDAIFKFHNEGREMSVLSLGEEIGNGGTGRRLREIAIRSENISEIEGEFDDYLRKFKQISIQKRLDELKGLIGEAERQSDIEKMRSLTREFQNLKLEVKANDARV